MQNKLVRNFSLLFFVSLLIFIPIHFAKMSDAEPALDAAAAAPPIAKTPTAKDQSATQATTPVAPTAFTTNLNVPLGNIKTFTVGGNILGLYLQYWYGFLIGTIGILATVMIMWGGFQYLTSAGDKGKAGDGQKIITSAVTGIVIAFGVYTILYLINPALLTINIPSIGSITTTPFEETDATAGGNQERPVAIAPGNITKSPGNSTWNAQNALSGDENLVSRATVALDTLQALDKLPAGLVVTSGYRSDAGNSYHTSGQAFDVTWPGITQAEAETFVANMMTVDPSLSSIIETDGENNSHWRVNNNAIGMGVHFDTRSGNPYHER